MPLARFSLLALALCTLLGIATPTVPAAAIRAASPTPPVPAPVSRVIEIDGRFITVELSIQRAIGGAPIDPPAAPTTTVHVTLSVNDGAALPPGLDAVGVRFEKLRGTKRFFFTRLTETDTSEPPPVEEHVQQDFQGDLSDHPTVKSLRAVVRLELDGQVVKVPMGTVRVNTLLLP